MPRFLPLPTCLLGLAVGSCEPYAPVAEQEEPADLYEPTHELWSRTADALRESTPAVEQAVGRVIEAGWNDTHAELEAYLEANRTAIETFLEASSSERTLADGVRISPPNDLEEDVGQDVVQDFQQDFGLDLEHDLDQDHGLGLARSRALVDLVLLESRRLARDGDEVEAIEHVLACLRFALQHHRSEHATVTPAAVAWALGARALEQMRDLLDGPQLEAREWREILAEMQRMRAGWTELDTILRNDRRQMLVLYIRSIQEQAGMDTMQIRRAVKRYHTLEAEYVDLLLLAWERRQPSIVRDWVAALEENVQDPTPRTIADRTAKVMLKISQSKLNDTIDLDLVARMEFDLVRVSLAGRLYALDHGEYPTRLRLLVPNYLPELPEDLFDTGRSVKLGRQAGRWRVYSLGPDRLDQGGRVAWARTDFDGGGDIRLDVSD